MMPRRRWHGVLNVASAVRLLHRSDARCGGAATQGLAEGGRRWLRLLRGQCGCHRECQGRHEGVLRRPVPLASGELRAFLRALHACGCSAVAVVARFPDDEDEAMLEAYRHGAGVDAIGGAEAIISHLVTQELSVPCAHAPALPPLDVDPDVSPRACAEELGYTFLPCVLANLHRAPSILRHDEERQPGCVTLLSGALYRTNVPFFFLQWTETRSIWARDIDAVVVPTSACGGNSCIEALRIS